MNKFAEYVVEAVMKCKQEQEASQNTVMKVIRYIEQNYTKTITKDELESISYMNINYLSRQFKTRLTFFLQYILNQYPYPTKSARNQPIGIAIQMPTSPTGSARA